MKNKPISAQTNFKKYFKDFRSCYYYLNKSIRNPKIRHSIYLAIRSVTPKSTSFNVKTEEISQLKKDGILILEQLLDADKVAKIRQFLAAKPVYNWVESAFNGKEKIKLNIDDVKITKQTKLKYFDEDIAQCKEIVEIANSDRILSLVSAYLGCKPTITSMTSWWTKAGVDGVPEKFYDDTYHRDVNDYKFIKLFIYLNDVEPENGAHSFIKGSHLSEKFTERRALNDAEVESAFDESDILALAGKSGTGILEDTWGIHRSMPCIKGERLLLHFLYCLTPYHDEAPRKPVAKNTYNVDPYINRVFLY